jgi:hypothetical protein
MESPNEDYPRKNWSSVILWDCSNMGNRKLTPEYVSNNTGAHLHRFQWLKDERVGDLPFDWNWLADEYMENKNAKLWHWTAGSPAFKGYRDSPHADEWRAVARRVLRGWDELALP